MRQFKTWTNNLEKESTTIPQVERVITRVEYKNQDRYEKSIRAIAFEHPLPVTKYYEERKKNIIPFGIGTSFEDLKMNSVVSTVMKESVWHPYYEINLEAEIDFKEHMQTKMQSNKEANIDGKDVSELKNQMIAMEQQFLQQNDAIKRQQDGLPAKQAFNYKDKIEALRRKEEADENLQVIDPYTIKVRKVQNDMEEVELEEIMLKFGELTRVKIPKNEDGTSRGIAFATFRYKEDCTKVADEGSIRYSFYELPVERATMSNKARERQQERGGGFGGGFRGEDGERSGRGGRGGFRDREGGFRDREGGFRDREGGFRGREGGFRGGDREGGFRGGDREGGFRGGFRGGDRGEGFRERRGERTEPDSGGFLKRNLNR